MKTKNSFKNMINTIVAMDNDLFLTVDDTTYYELYWKKGN